MPVRVGDLGFRLGRDADPEPPHDVRHVPESRAGVVRHPLTVDERAEAPRGMAGLAFEAVGADAVAGLAFAAGVEAAVWCGHAGTASGSAGSGSDPVGFHSRAE